MAGDWSGWLWTSEYGRDRMLRDEVDQASASAAAAHSRNARLRSELSQIRGSLEQRIEALSRAFDAYVELGDVREQLAAFPDTSQARVRALRAFDTLRAGGLPEPLSHGEGDYWLTHGMNALIARVGGSADAAAETRAAELGGAEFDTFWVCALGALGHGEQATGRLDRVLTNDGTFNPAQLQIFRLLMLGGYGPEPALEALRPALERESAETWRDWLTGRDGDPVRGLARLWDGAAPVPTDEPIPAGESMQAGKPVQAGKPAQAGEPVQAEKPEANPVGQARIEVAAVVTELIGRGQGEEGLLVARIRELRRTVESPLARTPDSARVASVSVGEAVRQALRDPDCTAVADRDLLRLARGPLLELVEAATVVPEIKPAVREARTHGLSVPVSATGPDATRLDRAHQSLVDRVPASHAVPIGIGAAAVLVLAVVLFVVGPAPAGLVLLLLGLGVAGYAWARAVSRRRGLQSVEDGRAALGREIGDVQRRMAETDEAARDEARRRAATAERLRAELQAAADRPLAGSLEP
ncbi:hypothetical protein [Enemella evansiae]|uniref:hypothetical protein n=1 Tax=Enemella evansiae TaxID=2016499 RepID=UPI0015C62B10|nr:hypothetical protein [Enemella evansiae]